MLHCWISDFLYGSTERKQRTDRPAFGDAAVVLRAILDAKKGGGCHGEGVVAKSMFDYFSTSRANLDEKKITHCRNVM